MNPAAQRPLLKYLVCLFLAGITFAAFAGVAHCSFVILDDGGYVVAQPAVQHGISWNSVKWAFSTFDCSNWHPLTWLSHMLDCRAFSLDPAGPHLTNLAFHVANTVLLFLLLEGLTLRLWPSAFVALLFGIHPMHVESVAWVSERKDVLSAFFFMMTLIAYTRYAELAQGKLIPQPAAPKPGEGGPAISVAAAQTAQRLRWLCYILALVFFALGLMSKPMLVTLPFVLLLLDFWPLERFNHLFTTHLGKAAQPLQRSCRGEAKRSRVTALAAPKPGEGGSTIQRLLMEKIPFFVLSAASCYVTFLAQSRGGAVRSVGEYSLLNRVEHVPIAYVSYILKFLWPVHLSVYYISLSGDTVLKFASSSLMLLVITAFAIRGVGKYPWFLCGWLWFLGILIPVIGLVQVGGQAYADRYTYLPYIGLFIVVAWAVPDLFANRGLNPSLKPSAARGSILQTAAPKPSEAGPVAPKPLNEGGPAASKRGENGSSISHLPSPISCLLWAGAALVAIACFVRTIQEVSYWQNSVTLLSRAIGLDPKNEIAWALLGAEYFNLGNNGKAEDCLNRSLALDRKYYLPWQYLGYLLSRKGDEAGAQNAWQTALECRAPDEAKITIYNRLGHLSAASGDFNTAASNYQNSLELSADQPQIQAELGQCLLQTKQPDAAAAAFQNALKLQPGNSEAQLGLGMVLASGGSYSDALIHLRAAVDADTNSVTALSNLAWLLAAAPDPALRNGPAAVSLAEHACQLTRYQQAQVIGTLADAYAEAGRFDDAVAAAQKAHEVALASGDNHVAARNAQLMELYKSHRAFHMGD